jgi:beta-1,4-mannooligosaccharide/beta-1,4-mannosyl-N-acetylglucosamine phosphorylase
VQTSSGEFVVRYRGNPILDASMWPYDVNAVFNPAAACVAVETLLLVRAEDRRGISHLTAARSTDGVSDWRIDAEPTLASDPAHPEEVWGIEDARITRLEEIGEWAITYTAFSKVGPLVALACTNDFNTFSRLGPVMPPETKTRHFSPDVSREDGP